MSKPKFAPDDVFKHLLEWSVFPTFDLVLYSDQGVLSVKRKLAPYKNQWALPGLRQYKGERFDDTLRRIARDQLGLEIDTRQKRFLGQYDGVFKTEYARQDISTAYAIPLVGEQAVQLNMKHFSNLMWIRTAEEIPSRMGAMYRFYLKNYFER